MKGFQSFFQVFYAFSIAVLTAGLLTACSSHSIQDSIDPARAPTSTLPLWDGTVHDFTEAKYIRNEVCGRVFDMHQIVYGPLTIGISENFIEQQNLQELAGEVIETYRKLYTQSPIPLSRSISVYILPDPDNGQCYSRGSLVFVSPDELDTRSFLEEFLEAGTGIGEYWILNGLASLILGEKSDSEVLQTFYESTDDLDIAGLFYAYFQEDWANTEEIQIAKMSATSLLLYALNEEHIPSMNLAEQVNNDVRTRWLKSLGVLKTVTYSYDGRFTRFIFYRKGDCSLNILAGNIHYCLNRLSDQEFFDEISDVEFFLDQTYYGRQAMEEYLLANAPSISSRMNTEEDIFFIVKEMEPGDRRALGYTNGNIITINQEAVYYYPLHEIVHTFDWNSDLDSNNAMLKEGFAEYIGKLLPLYPQTEKDCAYQDLTGRVHGTETVVPGKSYCYCLDPEQLEAAKQWYLAQGGQMDSEEIIDPRLFVDAVSFATIYRDAYAGSRGISIGEKYSQINPSRQYGLELNYTQAASFVGWLIDTYTIDRVLDVYVNGTEARLLDGKTYEELKSEWLADLIAKGEGIAIPKN